MKGKKQVTVTKAQLKKVYQKATMDGLVLFIATAMDEFGWTIDDVEKFSVRLNRYSEAVEEHLISIKQVKGIIADVMGLES
ncbi:MAG: hypothetical protein IKF39_01825 [Oscillospiraceae bacterium]|nr:hypothetical protein [Oscillospiraceae bacterium]